MYLARSTQKERTRVVHSKERWWYYRWWIAERLESWRGKKETKTNKWTNRDVSLHNHRSSHHDDQGQGERMQRRGSQDTQALREIYTRHLGVGVGVTARPALRPGRQVQPVLWQLKNTFLLPSWVTRSVSVFLEKDISIMAELATVPFSHYMEGVRGAQKRDYLFKVRPRPRLSKWGLSTSSLTPGPAVSTTRVWTGEVIKPIVSTKNGWKSEAFPKNTEHLILLGYFLLLKSEIQRKQRAGNIPVTEVIASEHTQRDMLSEYVTNAENSKPIMGCLYDCKYTWRGIECKECTVKSLFNFSEFLLLQKQEEMKTWCISLDWTFLNLAGNRPKIKKIQKEKLRK